jgi:N-acetyl-beta-hexosaminidase
LIDGVVTEVAALFPGEYTHKGGDEAFEGSRNPRLAAK